MGEIQQDFFQRIDGRFDLGADVIDSRRYLAVYGGHIGPGHVLDVDEITGLFAIAENRQIFPAGQGPGKEADAAKTAAKPSFDITKISILVAAFGMAFSCVTLALKALFKPWYTILLVLAALVVCISGPSMLITWIKLRKRNLGPILNANGWAINSKILVNSRFGSYFTHLVRLPKIKAVDPLSDKTPLWKKILLWLVFIVWPPVIR